MSNVIDNPVRSRFELVEDGMTAFANYHRNGAEVIVSHVEAPPPLRGKGTAARLMDGIVTIARDKGLKIVPLCSYATLWFRRHPDRSDVLV
jgi:predicted GNAT family acetyltransferase